MFDPTARRHATFKQLATAMDLLIHLKYGNAEDRQQTILAAGRVEVPALLEQYCTITFDPGRQLGKTRLICELAAEDDLIVVGSPLMQEIYISKSCLPPERVMLLRKFLRKKNLLPWRRIFFDAHRPTVMARRMPPNILFEKLAVNLHPDDAVERQIFLM